MDMDVPIWISGFWHQLPDSGSGIQLPALEIMYNIDLAETEAEARARPLRRNKKNNLKEQPKEQKSPIHALNKF